MINRLCINLCVASIFFALTPATQTHAAVHALLIGFNDYPGINQPLKGPLADVADLNQVLTKRGITDLVTMTNPNTKIADFSKQWAEMIVRAKAGDLIIVGFAGHGIRLPETRIPKRTPDGYDKGFLFPSFNESDHPDELLRDEDLYDRFKSASEKGLSILFIVDACHAGTGLRKVAQGTGAFRFRVYSERPNEPQVAAPANVAPRPPLAHVAAITAQVAEKAVAEVQIDGQNRGALSYAVARGLEGRAADADHSSSMTLDELWSYVRNVVRTRSENQQAPILFARPEDGNMPIFSQIDPETPKAPMLPQVPTIRLFASNSPKLDHVITAESKDRADLLWEPHDILYDPAGNLLSDEIDTQKLQGAIDARRLVLFLRTAAEQSGTLNVGFHKLGLSKGTIDDGYQVKDKLLQFESETSPFPYLTTFDVNADGTVNFLFPQVGDNPLQTDKAFPEISVQPPFGADYAVFIRSSEPLTETQNFFARKSYLGSASDFIGILLRDLRGTKFQIGIQGLYTCASLSGNGTCKLH